MRKTFLTILFAALLPLGLMAQGNVTEPGATEPNQLYTTTYDNPGGPNHAPGGPNRAAGDGWGGNQGSNPGQGEDGSPIGAPWALLAFAAAYAGVRLVKNKKE